MKKAIQYNKTIFLNLLVSFLGSLLSNMTQAATVYEHFTLIDPKNSRVVEDSYLVVADDTISLIGQGAAPVPDAGESWEYVDMSGTYALPGFFDSHAHITAGPLTVSIEENKPILDMSSQDDITRHSALMALAFGVTTVRNPAGDPLANQHYNEQVEQGRWLGPEALHAGFTFDPTPIRGGSVYPATEEGWRAEIQRQKSLGMDYIKLYTGLNEEELALGIRLAHEQDMKTIGHLDQVSWLTAVELGIDALTHALPTSADLLDSEVRSDYLDSRSSISSTFMYQWFEKVDYQSESIQNLIATLAETGVIVDLTLFVNQLTYFFDESERVFPQSDRQYYHPEINAGWEGNMQASHYGWTEEDYRRAHAVFPKVLQFARLLHDAGVAMLIGTDSYGGGVNFSTEMSLHAQAGLSNWEILSLATDQSAERLGLDDRTGSLEAGLEADIVFLNSSPLTDISNTRDIHTTVVNGRGFSFAQLIRSADEFTAP